MRLSGSKGSDAAAVRAVTRYLEADQAHRGLVWTHPDRPHPAARLPGPPSPADAFPAAMEGPGIAVGICGVSGGTGNEEKGSPPSPP